MKFKRELFVNLTILLGILAAPACGVRIRPTPPPAPPPVVTPAPPATLSFDIVACKSPFIDNYCDGPAGAIFRIKVGNPDSWIEFKGDGNGYAWASGVPNVPDSDIEIRAPGYERLLKHISPPVLVATNAKGIHNVWDLTPSHVDPSGIPLEQLAAIRGAMWPKGPAPCSIPMGPRPGSPDNIIATDFITEYDAATQDCLIGELKRRGYTHVVMGPLVDSDGYHGQYTPNDWRGRFSEFLDAIQKFWDHGLTTVVWIKPDNWTLDQMKAELTPLLSQERARKLIRAVVPMGWEAGANYEYSSCTWAEAGKWAAQVLPNAIRLIHLPSDRDAPVGGDARCNDDDRVWNPGGNAAGWGRVAPYYHGWLVQNGAFECPTCIAPNGKTNFQNFQDQFDLRVRASLADRFINGYAGWPRFSAWGAGMPLTIYAGEYSSFWRYWQNRPEAEGEAWGDSAIQAGARGYLDSGTVAVP